MPANLVSATDLYGERHWAWTDGADILYTNDTLQAQSPPATITVLTNDTDDAPIDLTISADGVITITYLDASGARLSKSSQRDGDDGTWS